MSGSRCILCLHIALLAIGITAQAQDSTPNPTPTPTATPLVPPTDSDAWTCSSLICCYTNPPWLDGWFMQNLPDGDSCQLELQVWGYVLVAAIVFVLSSLCCLMLYFTRLWSCWDICRPLWCCCQPEGDDRADKVSTSSVPLPIAGWAPIVPSTAYKGIEEKDPLVPDYHPANHDDTVPVFDFTSYVSSLAPDTAASIMRRRTLETYNMETQHNGHARHVAYMLGQRILPGFPEFPEEELTYGIQAAPTGVGGDHETTLEESDIQKAATDADRKTQKQKKKGEAAKGGSWWWPFGRTAKETPGEEEEEEEEEDENGEEGADGDAGVQQEGDGIGQGQLHHKKVKRKRGDAEGGEEPPAKAGWFSWLTWGKSKKPVAEDADVEQAGQAGEHTDGHEEEGDSDDEEEGAAAEAPAGSLSPTKKRWITWPNRKQKKEEPTAEHDPDDGEEDKAAEEGTAGQLAAGPDASPAKHRFKSWQGNKEKQEQSRRTWLSWGKKKQEAEPVPEGEEVADDSQPVTAEQQERDGVALQAVDRPEDSDEEDEELPAGGTAAVPPGGSGSGGQGRDNATEDDDGSGDEADEEKDDAPDAAAMSGRGRKWGGLFGGKKQQPTETVAPKDKSPDKKRTGFLGGFGRRNKATEGPPEGEDDAPEDGEQEEERGEQQQGGGKSGRGGLFGSPFKFGRGKPNASDSPSKPQDDAKAGEQRSGDPPAGDNDDWQDKEGGTDGSSEAGTEPEPAPQGQPASTPQQERVKPEGSDRGGDNAAQVAEVAAAKAPRSHPPAQESIEQLESDSEEEETQPPPKQGGLAPLKLLQGGLAPLSGGLAPLSRPPGGGLQPLGPAKLGGLQPPPGELTSAGSDEIQPMDSPTADVDIKGALSTVPSQTSTRYANLEGTVTDLSDTAAMRTAANAGGPPPAAMSPQPQPPPQGAGAGRLAAVQNVVRDSLQSFDSDDGF
mmetsp:Transcript_15622/g.43687  ORF Transcript_15622/g.43687 Transcript_15622/m.43687 type:complete len:951 (+) Transcript_15622:218-3070(+)|eukprot:CAMPEP_0117656584 /NCGR_PEP_ID=MMETSP0804-20121206/4882_1 /TAXON_ID=1074897 /ORGANISM="Tetraselmis astigmatica, Strain CCMP880" /LENGTH=950 /DNA_ID=CAMNT_0005462995 /DNA_START=148 /DNA_END=3000 /DNA_ORIENTATION=-